MIYPSYDLNPISKRSVMRKQTHKVELTSEERQTLETLIRKGEHSALKLMRAHILLKADRKGPCWTDARISEAFGCDAQTAHNVRKRFASGERLGALERKKQGFRPSHLPKLDGAGEARWIALEPVVIPPKGSLSGRWGCLRINSLNFRLLKVSLLKPSDRR